MGKEDGRLVREIVDRLNKYHFVLVVLLSLIHIGLAYAHTRDSGRTALLLH